MKFLCKIFGHKPPVYAKAHHWSPGHEYGRLHNDGTDGIGQPCGYVTADCARCGEHFRIVRVHAHNPTIKCENID